MKIGSTVRLARGQGPRGRRRLALVVAFRRNKVVLDRKLLATGSKVYKKDSLESLSPRLLAELRKRYTSGARLGAKRREAARTNKRQVEHRIKQFKSARVSA